MTNPLRELRKYGQSVWYDNLNRELIITGALQRMVDEDGVSGGTSNPSIFEKAVASGNAYDKHLQRLVDEGRDLPEIYDALTVTDVRLSAEIFRPIYDETRAQDGYSSLEVSPLIADDTQASIDAAHRLFAALDSQNAMIKIPGTPAGLPAIERCLSDGLNINITLLFGVENYEQVAWAYVSALEKRWAAGQPIDRIGSVASFFVSRVDSLVDKKLQDKIASATSDANANAFGRFSEKQGSPTPRSPTQSSRRSSRALAGWCSQEAGAKVQRCLWASTSTKNPEYRDVMYVEQLIGPDTINTMPQKYSRRLP